MSSLQRIGHTLPGRLVCHAERSPDRVALREKDLGRWEQYSWAEYRQQVERVACVLSHWGIGSGDCVSILSDNRSEWLFCDLAIQSLGGVSTGVYQTNPPEDVAYVLNHSQAKVLFIEDQEQLDKILEIETVLPYLQQVVIFDSRGTRGYEDPRLVRWEAFQALADELHADFSYGFIERLEKLDADAPAMIIYTSGTTGTPKGAMLSANNVLPQAELSIVELDIGPDDTVLSYLPLCHVAEKIFSLFLPLTIGITVHFGESLETVQVDLREVSPTVFLGVPRIWEKMHASVQIKMTDASWLKKKLYHWAVRIGRTNTSGIKLWLADMLVLRALRERIGMAKCHQPVSGAAPVAPELLQWFHAIGVKINEGYGLSESTGLSHANRRGAQKLGSVGPPVGNVECRIADDGEVLIRGSNIFLGYLHNDEATAETIDTEGWLHTGDIGSLDDDDFLTITGRKKEIMITAGGKNLSPQKIENALKTSIYIKEAASLGDARKFVAALIQIEVDAVGDWASRKRIPYTSFEDLSAKTEVVQLIDEEIRRLNDSLARVEQVRAFRLLPKELHQDDGELTATQKLRRKIVYEKFAHLIDDIYGTAQ